MCSGGTGGADVSAQMCKQRRVVATDRRQVGAMSGRGRTAAGLDGAVQRGTAASGLRGAIASGRRGAVAKPQGDVWATSEGRNNLKATTSGRQQLRPPRGGAEQRGVEAGMGDAERRRLGWARTAAN